MDSPTGRRVTGPNIQNIPMRTPEGTVVRNAITGSTTMAPTHDDLKYALDAGQADALALVPGDVFKGAWGHAADRDIGPNKNLERAAYTCGFLAVIEQRWPNGVRVDGTTGAILQPE